MRLKNAATMQDKQGNVNYIVHESTLYVQFIRTNAMSLDLPHIR